MAREPSGRLVDDPVTELTHKQLIAALRSALHNLYNPVQLRNSPLVPLLQLDNHFDRAQALQTHLSSAIRALKPASTEPPNARAWQLYDILHFQYIQQMNRTALANQLGISERQLRREQRVALEVLAQQLHGPLEQPFTNRRPPDEPRTEENAAANPEAGTGAVAEPLDETTADAEQTLSEELLWLTKQTAEGPIALGDALAMVQTLVQPLANQWQVPVQVEIAPLLAAYPVPPLLLRSILPTVLTVAIPRADQQPVIIAATQVDDRLTISITHHAVDGPPSLSEKESATLQTAEAVAQFHGVDLTIDQSANRGFVATLSLPLPKQIPVLVVDDNADWLALQQRYVVGSRYQLTGTTDSVHAAALAIESQPALILLDVMMHQVDGWQILSDLRHEPATATIPIVVCTILPVADLAFALGASAFLQKPVTRERYLQTLARWAVGQ